MQMEDFHSFYGWIVFHCVGIHTHIVYIYSYIHSVWILEGKNTGVGCHALLQGSSGPRNWTRISCVSRLPGGLFTTSDTWAVYMHTHTHTHTVHSLIHSSVDGHLGFFHILAIVNNAAMNTGVHVSFQISVFVFGIYTQERNCWVIW